MSECPSPSKSGSYVYCIVRAEPFRNGAFPSARSIAGGTTAVRYIEFMDISAVVSDCDVARYDVSRVNTIAHQLVIEEAMARSEVLPVRFNTIAKQDDDVREKLLKRKFGEFHYLLQYVQGRVELGLKVFWNRERLFAEIVADNRDIRLLRDAVAERPPDEMRHERIRLGQMTEEAVVRKRDLEAEAIVSALRPLAAETKVNKILTDTMLLNAAFLIDKSKEVAFDSAVNALDRANSGRLVVKYAGPLPPYNFVNVVVQWEED